jgi:4-aminobutyrate aminotransferase-like enzyme
MTGTTGTAVSAAGIGEPRTYPGPRAAAVIARARAIEGAGPRTGAVDAPLVVESAANATLVDPDGNAFLDLAGSFAAANVGHSHPDVVAAIRDQAARSQHVSSAALSEARVAFEEALLGLAPSGLDRVLLGLSGSDANDTALKLARTLTGRREVLAFSGGYFGRGGGVVGIDGKVAFREAAGRDVEAHFVPYPSPAHWPLPARDETDVADQALALVGEAIEGPASGIGPLAAIVLEPVQGNGGIVEASPAFLRGVRELCDRHGIVLIVDEIQSGFGRTGVTWAIERAGVVPDLMTVGKGIGGGQPVSAVVGRASAMSHWKPGGHTSTFLGNTVDLAAGRAALEVFTRERLAERAARLGAGALDRLRDALADDPHVREVRGFGLLIGIELVTDRTTREPDAARVAAIRRHLLGHGIVTAAAGHHDQVVKLSPPLTIPEIELTLGLDLVVDAIRGAA